MAKKKISKKSKINYEPIIHLLAIIVVVLFIVNIFFISSLSSSLKEKIAEAEETARPANLDLVIITAPCDNCFNIQEIVDKIKSGNVNITYEVTLTESEAKNFLWKNLENLPINLLERYNIQKLPTVIVMGELNKTNLNSTLTQVDNVLIFTSQTAPYYDVASERVKGLVVATIINPTNCTNCTSLSPVLAELQSNGVVIARSTTLNEEEGADLIQTYAITTLPSLVLSSDASEYPIVVQNWPALGSVEFDGNYILRSLLPPYKNLTSGNIEGLVSLTYLVDSSCEDCYNITLHKRILQSYNLAIVNEETIDISSDEGKALLSTNNITLVPTIILSKEAKLYPAFYRIFSQVSKEVQDGVVFTALELMGKYKDLETNEIITPEER